MVYQREFFSPTLTWLAWACALARKTPQPFSLLFPFGVVFALHVPQEGSLFLLVLLLYTLIYILSFFLEKIHSQKIASDLQSESSSLVLKGLTVSPMHNPFCKEFIHSFKILCLHSFNIEKLYHQQVCWRLWNFIARQMEINNVFFFVFNWLNTLVSRLALQESKVNRQYAITMIPNAHCRIF